MSQSVEKPWASRNQPSRNRSPRIPARLSSRIPPLLEATNYGGGVTILVCGGGLLTEIEPLIQRFIKVTGESHRQLALITAGGINHAELRERLQQRFTIGFELALDATVPTAPVDGSELLTCDIIVVSGDNPGLLLNALQHRVVDMRRLVHGGAAYFGIDAGAALASDIAWIGGNAVGGVPVAPALETAEIEFAEGIGLIDITVIPDAIGSGRVGLAAAAVEANIVDRIVAIDSGTAIEVAAGSLAVRGSGTIWQFQRDDERVMFTSMRASDVA
ncbi:Type 1 glutamine amidotransferase-like domain-containing protein [uncultured Gulosibacter sp.]|uniref:Type 1 glutamine amidotransferase-like domain-containing protein n=1 Tax=uncultured Gulosibacter sp. TaxID=1339167 RepID=UPI00288B6E37|nr:Type 1 glutamine amidotransferase-like domain-containing protein [uncultured Gulosibacter sp.]